ncbi:imelysin family protein [Chitinophaga sancti]|uniref:imelysin family protein n=1 Tax=Chitinophaga sancti TaxID=1004 RepID=UPI003F79378E
MKKLVLLFAVSAITILSCSKDGDNGASNSDFAALEDSVTINFVNKTAIPGYEDLLTKATTFNNVVTALNSATTEDNLTAAKTAWKDMRKTWEQCEGYLFGPVEDDNYDPNMDTWPVDYVQMDSLLNSSNALEIADIEGLATLSLRGYHPIEYILWGTDGKRAAAALTAREKKYITSLTVDLKNTCTKLRDSWVVAGGNYAAKVLNAGKGSQPFPTKQSLFTAIAAGLADICGEVGESKMKDPYDAQDPNIVESPFSGNSTTDFKNNIVGAYNVYMGTFLGSNGKSLHALVAAKNLSLDTKLQQQFEAAIGSFDAITMPYEKAIISQRGLCATTMSNLVTLKGTIEGDLENFILTNIKD